MPAGVVKPLQGALFVAHQQYLLVTQFKRPESSSASDIAGPADIHPVAIPDALQLPLILARVEVGIRRQAFGMFRKAVVAQLDRGSTHLRHYSPCRDSAKRSPIKRA